MTNQKRMRGFLLYNGAIPTEPDVNALIEKIGIPKVGDQIAYSRVTEVIGVDRKSSRWNSVVTAWRKELQDNHGLILKAIPNEGFDVLTDDGKVSQIQGYVKRAANSFRRADRVAQRVNRNNLTNESKVSFDHYNRIRATLELAERTAAKELDYPDPEHQNGNMRQPEKAAA